MTAIKPKPGFMWSAVTWGRPDQLRTTKCSYCSAPLDDESVPLILTSDAGCVAEFCESCQRRWWGFEF